MTIFQIFLTGLLGFGTLSALAAPTYNHSPARQAASSLQQTESELQILIASIAGHSKYGVPPKLSLLQRPAEIEPPIRVKVIGLARSDRFVLGFPRDLPGRFTLPHNKASEALNKRGLLQPRQDRRRPPPFTPEQLAYIAQHPEIANQYARVQGWYRNNAVRARPFESTFPRTLLNQMAADQIGRSILDHARQNGQRDRALILDYRRNHPNTNRLPPSIRPAGIPAAILGPMVHTEPQHQQRPPSPGPGLRPPPPPGSPRPQANIDPATLAAGWAAIANIAHQSPPGNRPGSPGLPSLGGNNGFRYPSPTGLGVDAVWNPWTAQEAAEAYAAARRNQGLGNGRPRRGGGSGSGSGSHPC